ncbi:unnamed protein product, partial [Amoebophrya sp. A120]
EDHAQCDRGGNGHELRCIPGEKIFLLAIVTFHLSTSCFCSRERNHLQFHEGCAAWGLMYSALCMEWLEVETRGFQF